MASRDQIASQIRFQLEQLSARNGHHDFEHLCRHLARLRICSNILPATGPVSAGGDQGRDFETFRTYLSESLIAGSSFLGLASQKPIVFACTLTKQDNLRPKIKADVAAILRGGTPVSDIHCFCSSDMPVAQRHELQKWARETHGIDLEIYDGQAIAELLVHPDVFWIAMNYLSIPSEIYPSTPINEEERWYIELRSKWKDSDWDPENFADFGELKSAVRHATFTENARQDLPFWIQRLTSLKNATSWTPLQRRSTYEIAVASLRGLGTLEGREDQLRGYFSDIHGLTDTADIEDAAVLWAYCAAARRRNLLSLELEELISWRDAVITKADEELSRVQLPGRRCSLLDIRGYLYLVMPSVSPEGKPDIVNAVSPWLELLDLVSNAPLFPLERFADRLTTFITWWNHPAFDKLTSRADELLAERHGHFVAATKCRDRAIALYENGEITRAIKQVHSAKVKWFTQEALHGSVLSMLFLSKCYLDLGLAFAAKYYALAARGKNGLSADPFAETAR